MVLMARLREVRRTFLRILDDELVAPLQAIFYVFFILGSIYLLGFTDEPIESLGLALGPVVSDLWSGMLVCGPLIWLVGRRTKGSGAYLGLWLQLIGDFVTCGALVVYVWSIIDNTPFGKAVFSPSIATPTCLCIALLTFRDIRRIAQVERQVQRDKRGRR